VAEHRVPSGLRWLLLGVVLFAALFVGSGILDRHAPTQAERISALESSLKCPSCQDLSVAQSTSPSSLAVRAEVVSGVRQGKSDEQIVAGLRARYGTAVDLTPSGGLSSILWIVPALFALGVVVAVVLAVRRRRSAAS
jgi:cytochrome c-type biogenesis protein CcmH